MAQASMHEMHLPGESEEYRRARDELLTAEIELRRRVGAVAAQRRRLPLGGIVPDDYTFQEWDGAAKAGRPVRLSQLFEEGKDTLFLYNHMFIPGAAGLPLEQGCPLCTSIIDGIDGAVPHITQLVNFAVVAKAPIERFRAHGQARGWRHTRLLSSANNTYNRDYHGEDAGGEQRPVATVFVRRDGRIHHSWTSELAWIDSEPGQDPRHVDFMWPMWAVIDRTPGGRTENWVPKLDYAAAD
jgi:predicted dithiol-disulfide oxidoreductase (DUF899 family)